MDASVVTLPGRHGFKYCMFKPKVRPVVKPLWIRSTTKNIEASNMKETVPTCAIVPFVWQNSTGIYQSTLIVLFFTFSSVTHGSSLSCILAYLISEGSVIF